MKPAIRAAAATAIFVDAMQARGIPSAVHYPLPAHMQPVYAGLAAPGSLPVTERLANEVLSLPIYPELTAEEVDYVIDAVKSWEK